MLRKLLATVLGLFLVLAGIVAYLYATNGAPMVAAVTATEAASPTKPYVVKLHARWCSVCMITQNVWPQIEQAYAGKVNLLVLDFTDEKTTAASREEAKRLGLEAFFDEYLGVTGPIVVLDGKTKTVKSEIGGERSFAPYRDAIEAALAPATN